MKHLVQTPEQALVYLTECTLATVSSMAMKKSKSKYEYERQISIAQTGIDWINDFKIKVKYGSRVQDIIASEDGQVKTWINLFHNM